MAVVKALCLDLHASFQAKTQTARRATMADKRMDPTSDAARSDPKTADKEREELKKKAEEGMKDATGDLPKDQV
jgi:hypothetical protein